MTAKHKLIDILDRRKQGQTGLIVYAGDAHIVSPLTDDTDTIKALVPALSPLIMPAMGSRVDTATQLANRLLKDAGVSHGRVLLMTDGLQAKRIDAITDNLSAHSLSILAFGTEDGGPIPLPKQGFLKQQGDIVIARLDMAPIQALARAGKARLSRAQITDNDINYLLEPGAFDLEFNRSTRQVDRQFDQWHETGPWLLLGILPLAALAFRRGWLLGVVLLVMIQPPPALATDNRSFWNDLWRTPDQQGQQAFSEGQHSQASELFKSPLWKGSAAYRAGDFETAIESFSKIDSAQAHYNRGNALARSGDLEEALNAYNKALALNPGMNDARANKALVERLKQQQDLSQGNQNQQNDGSSPGQEGKDQAVDNQQSSNNDQQTGTDAGHSRQDGQSSSGSNDPLNEQQDSTKKQGKTEDQSPGQANKEGNKKPEVNHETDGQSALANNAPPLTDEQRQAAEQWLRRIPDDPGGLLKRKFDYQYRQRQLNNQFLAEQEDTTLW